MLNRKTRQGDFDLYCAHIYGRNAKTKTGFRLPSAVSHKKLKTLTQAIYHLTKSESKRKGDEGTFFFFFFVRVKIDLHRKIPFPHGRLPRDYMGIRTSIVSGVCRFL